MKVHRKDRLKGIREGGISNTNILHAVEVRIGKVEINKSDETGEFETLTIEVLSKSGYVTTITIFS